MRVLLGLLDGPDRDGMRDALSDRGCTVECVGHGHDAIERAGSASHDVIVIADGLPDLSACEAAGIMRRVRIESPIIVVGADDVKCKVCALDAGADDYVASAIHADELAARLRALVRRVSADQGTWLRHGGLEVHLPTRTIRRNGTLIRLTPRESTVLEHLLRGSGRVVPRSQLFERVWGGAPMKGDGNVVDVYVSRIRRKLHIPGEPDVIQTVPGTGYILDCGELRRTAAGDNGSQRNSPSDGPDNRLADCSG